MSETLRIGVIGDCSPSLRSHQATAFLPQFSWSDGRPHALIMAYLEAAHRNWGRG